MSDQTLTFEEAQEQINVLKTQIEELTLKQEENLNGWKRAQADYINFKNDQEKRSKELAQFAAMSLAVQFVPLLENFRNAFKQVPEELKTSEWVKGVEQISKQVRDILKSVGLEESEEQVGKKFDPSIHQSVGAEQRDDVEDEVVSQQTGGGYMYHGKIIVPAKVIVNKKNNHETQNVEHEIGDNETHLNS